MFKIYKDKTSKDYQFQDRLIGNQIRMSGTPCMIHKYIGPYKQDPKDNSLTLPQNEDILNEMSIQDILFGENRDRKYSDDLYEATGIYTVSDNDFDMSAFGYLLNADSIVMEWHISTLVDLIGRRLMPGDVIELVHLREHNSLDSEATTIKKYYVVQDSTYSSNGYGPTWQSHVWRTRCKPIIDTQEYRDILHNEQMHEDNDDIGWLTDDIQYGESDTGVRDMSRLGDETHANDLSIYDHTMKKQEQLQKYEREEVEKRSFEVSHFYIKECDEQIKSGLIHYILNGDGFPANHDGSIIYSGDRFPLEAVEGDYFVRTDYEPARLFRKTTNRWSKVNDVWRRDWVPAHRILESFINDEEMTSVGIHADDTFEERQALSSVILPKAKNPPPIKY